MKCNTPGFLVLHYLLEFAQSHVHRVDDLGAKQQQIPVLYGTTLLFQLSPVSRVRLFATPWTAARQASLCFTISWSLLKSMSIELVMPSNHLNLCCPLLLLLSIFPSIRVFSNESVLRIRRPKYWSFSFSILLPKLLSSWFSVDLYLFFQS